MSRLVDDVDVKRSLGYVLDAISLTRHRLDGRCPLLGFSGAPVSYNAQARWIHTYKYRLYAHLFQ